MGDNTNKTGEPDRSLVSLVQDHEVRYWTKRFGVSEEKLKRAVTVVGSSALAVEAWLKSH